MHIFIYIHRHQNDEDVLVKLIDQNLMYKRMWCISNLPGGGCLLDSCDIGFGDYVPASHVLDKTFIDTGLISFTVRTF